MFMKVFRHASLLYLCVCSNSSAMFVSGQENGFNTYEQEYSRLSHPSSHAGLNAIIPSKIEEGVRRGRLFKFLFDDLFAYSLCRILSQYTVK